MPDRADPVSYEALDQARLREALARDGSVVVRLDRRRAGLFAALLRHDEKLRGYGARAGSGIEAMADLGAGIYLTTRVYLFHRRLFELLPLLLIHDARLERRPAGGGWWVLEFTLPEGDQVDRRGIFHAGTRHLLP